MKRCHLLSSRHNVHQQGQEVVHGELVVCLHHPGHGALDLLIRLLEDQKLFTGIHCGAVSVKTAGSKMLPLHGSRDKAVALKKIKDSEQTFTLQKKSVNCLKWQHQKGVNKAVPGGITTV